MLAVHMGTACWLTDCMRWQAAASQEAGCIPQTMQAAVPVWYATNGMASTDHGT